MKGYAYAAPCTLSLEAAREAQGLVTSVVIGYDMVPRFSLGAVEDLQRAVSSVVDLGARADELCHELEDGLRQDVEASAAAMEFMTQLAAHHSERLYPPGRIMHIRADRADAERRVVSACALLSALQM